MFVIPRSVGVLNSDASARRAHFVWAVLLLRLVLDICYVAYLNPAFGDHFLTPMDISFDYERYALSLAFVGVPLAFLPFGKRNLSGIFFMGALLFLYLPMTSMYGLDSSKSTVGMVAALSAVSVAYFTSLLTLRRTAVPMLRGGERIVMRISFVVVLIFIVWAFLSGAVANINFNLDDIYYYRDLTGRQLDVGFMAYLNLWAQKVFNPLLFAIALHRRSRPMVLATLAAQLFFFAVTQHRSHIFAPLLIYMIFLLYRNNLSLARLYLYTAILLLTFLLITIAAQFDEAAALVLRRAFFVPASVTFQWIEFFEGTEKVYWSDNLLAGILGSSPGARPLPYVLGDALAPGLELAFNSGIVGAGFAQAGLAGVIMYAAILGFVLRVCNAFIRQGLPTYFAAAILLAPIRTAWADSDLFAALLSHGLLVGLVALWLLGKPSQVNRHSVAGPSHRAIP